jgi:hypothetical protein
MTTIENGLNIRKGLYSYFVGKNQELTVLR